MGSLGAEPAWAAFTATRIWMEARPVSDFVHFISQTNPFYLFLYHTSGKLDIKNRFSYLLILAIITCVVKFWIEFSLLSLIVCHLVL